MGWNEGFRIMEEQVVELYDLGILNKKVLDGVMKPFEDTDIDSGGSMNLKSNDGKTAEEIICFIVEPEKYNEATKSGLDWNNNDELIDLWYEITRKRWGFC